MTPPVPPSQSPRLLYCHCQYAQIVPAAVKTEVLRRLCEANVPFDAVPDLCELSARRDPELRRLADPAAGPLKIAACFPRAVKWLFANAGAPLAAAHTEVANMRVDSADVLATTLLSPRLNPNLPAGKTAPPPAEATPAAPAPSDSALG